MIDLSLAILIVSSLTGVGLLVLRGVIGLGTGSRLEGILFGCAVGYGLTAYIFLLFGVLRLYYPITARLYLLACMVCAASYLIVGGCRRGSGGVLKKNRPCSVFEVGVIVILAGFIVINLLNSAVPTMNADTLREYFLYPKVWIQNHGQTGDFRRFYSDNITLITGLMNTFGMLLRGEVLAQMLTGFSMGILCALAVYRLCLNYFNRGMALLAATLFYSSRIVIWISPSGKINLCLGFYEILSVYALFRWWEAAGRGEKGRWLVVMALMCGFAVNVHTGAVLMVSVLGFSLAASMMLRERLGLLRTGKYLLLFGAIVLASGFPLYLKNYIVVGNPFFPKLTGIFGGEALRRGTNVDFVNLVVCQGLTGYFKIFWVNTMEAWRNISQPPSPLLLALVPCLLFIRKPDKRIVLMIGYCFLFSILWYMTAQRNRYALSAIALLSICGAYVLYSCSGRGKAILSIVIFLAVLFSFREDIRNYSRACASDRGKILYALNLTSKDKYLDEATRRKSIIPNYAMCRYINDTLGEGARVFAVHDQLFFRLKRPYLSARWPQGEAIMRVKDEDELLRLLRGEGITHVLYNDTFVSEINAWFKKISGWRSYLPQDNLFSQSEFRQRHLRLLFQDANEYFYEVVYPAQ